MGLVAIIALAVVAYFAVGIVVSALLTRFVPTEFDPSDAGGFAIVWPFVVLILVFWAVFDICGRAARRIAGK